MSDRRRNRALWDWYGNLDPEEKRAFGALEREAHKLDKRRRELTREMGLLRNRGTHRAKYAGDRL